MSGLRLAACLTVQVIVSGPRLIPGRGLGNIAMHRHEAAIWKCLEETGSEQRVYWPSYKPTTKEISPDPWRIPRRRSCFVEKSVHDLAENGLDLVPTRLGITYYAKFSRGVQDKR